MTDLEIKLVIRDALTEAKNATEKYLEDNNSWYPCGFAWVKIKPARGRFVAILKEMGLGRTSEFGGFVVYNPSNNPTQSMNAKMAGAVAFATVLTKAGLNAQVESRID